MSAVFDKLNRSHAQISLLALALGAGALIHAFGAPAMGLAFHPPSPDGGRGPHEVADLATEADVLEAAFRQQIREHLDATERARRTVVCIAIDPGGAPQSPNREFMARLAGERMVRRAAECDPRPTGAIEAMTLRPAIIVTAGPIEWIADDEVWVEVSYFRSARQSAHRRYRVVREHDGWVSLGPILLDGPVR
jgi:hypothetical protein